MSEKASQRPARDGEDRERHPLAMENLVSLCASRGFVFPASEIYGGIAGFWDYGPLGVELKNNLKAVWWNRMVRERDDGPPVDQRFALVHRSQYEIIDTWHAVGLSGTGSKDVAIKGLFVPDYRTVTAWAMNGKPHPGSTVNPSPLFRLPMLALGPYVLSGIMLGCAQGAYETVVGAARKRNATTTGQPVGASQAVQLRVAEASARIDAAEMMMGAVCTHAMEAASAGREPLHEDKLRYRRDAFFSVRLCLEAVDMLMTVAGSSGLYLSGTMQRLFRDAHAANAHVMFSPDVQGAMFGQHALGMAGPPPLL